MHGSSVREVETTRTKEESEGGCPEDGPGFEEAEKTTGLRSGMKSSG